MIAIFMPKTLTLSLDMKYWNNVPQACDGRHMWETICGEFRMSSLEQLSGMWIIEKKTPLVTPKSEWVTK
jgi:hypothetical protein